MLVFCGLALLGQLNPKFVKHICFEPPHPPLTDSCARFSFYVPVMMFSGLWVLKCACVCVSLCNLILQDLSVAGPHASPARLLHSFSWAHQAVQALKTNDMMRGLLGDSSKLGFSSRSLRLLAMPHIRLLVGVWEAAPLSGPYGAMGAASGPCCISVFLNC